MPLADTVAYVNFDIQGANLSPSLRNSSFAVAAESGGERFQSIVRSAINASTLDTDQLSSIFGQNRSDYVSFLAKQVPSVFFTDATGPCYHTNDDEIGIVDFDKLDQQIAIALRVTRELAGTDDPPEFTPGYAARDLRRRRRAPARGGADLARPGPLLRAGPGDAERDQGRPDPDRARRPRGLRQRRRRHRDQLGRDRGDQPAAEGTRATAS